MKRALLVALLLGLTVRFDAASPIRYRFTFPEPQHRWMQVEATFTELPPAPLELRMSRSSPGRYSLHDFAKNVYDVHVFAADGAELRTTRSDPYGWNVPSHGTAVTVKYKLFGDRVDGTYLAIDTTHAHINMPAAIMWARGLDDRPAVLSFEPPGGAHWQAATQLHASGALEFTAPNLQYLMDSPVEFGPVAMRQFSIGGRTFRFALHHRGTDAELDSYMKDVEKVVRQEGAIFGEFPDYEPGTYTFLADYLPYAHGDGMEHRNSTVMTAAGSLATDRPRLLDTVAHEFFHCWNVERIRPQGLEPFDFDRAEFLRRTVARGRLHPGPTARWRCSARGWSIWPRQRGPSPSSSKRSSGAGAYGADGRGDERYGAVHRRRPHGRSHELAEQRHLVLSVRRRNRARARPDAARSHRRTPVARRLHARDVA